MNAGRRGPPRRCCVSRLPPPLGPHLTSSSATDATDEGSSGLEPNSSARTRLFPTASGGPVVRNEKGEFGWPNDSVVWRLLSAFDGTRPQTTRDIKKTTATSFPSGLSDYQHKSLLWADNRWSCVLGFTNDSFDRRPKTTALAGSKLWHRSPRIHTLSLLHTHTQEQTKSGRRVDPPPLCCPSFFFVIDHNAAAVVFYFFPLFGFGTAFSSLASFFFKLAISSLCSSCFASLSSRTLFRSDRINSRCFSAA